MRLTDLGYPVVNEDIHSRLFGLQAPRPMSKLQVQKAKSLLKEFKIPTPVDYPSNLYDGPLPLPELKADNLKNHFEVIAEEGYIRRQ